MAIGKSHLSPIFIFTNAAYKGDVTVVRTILKATPDIVNEKGDLDSTALHWAALEGHVEIVKILLSHGANIDAKEDGSRTPLHLASLGSHVDIARVLISSGANVNARDHAGNTPLHEAARHLCDAMVEILLASGASVNAGNHADETPLDIATTSVLLSGHTEVEDILRNHGGETTKKKNGSAYSHGARELGESLPGAETVKPRPPGVLVLSGKVQHPIRIVRADDVLFLGSRGFLPRSPTKGRVVRLFVGLLTRLFFMFVFVLVLSMLVGIGLALVGIGLAFYNMGWQDLLVIALCAAISGIFLWFISAVAQGEGPIVGRWQDWWDNCGTRWVLATKGIDPGRLEAARLMGNSTAHADFKAFEVLYERRTLE